MTSIINSYVINYQKQIPHMDFEKIGLYHVYPIEVYTNPTLQKTTIDECKLQSDQHSSITLRIFFVYWSRIMKTIVYIIWLITIFIIYN